MADENNRVYFYQEATKTIFFSTDWPKLDSDLHYLGVSNNKNRKMAAGIFMKRWKGHTGCKIREYTGE